FTTVANLAATGLEGAPVGPIASIASFNDPAGVGVETTADFTATINWGDTTTSPGTVVSDGGGNYHVDAPAHTYAEERTYTVTVTLKHDALAPVPRSGHTITTTAQYRCFTAVANLPATGREGAALRTIPGIATFNDPAGVGVETVADFTATINWGDTTTSA